MSDISSQDCKRIFLDPTKLRIRVIELTPGGQTTLWLEFLTDNEGFQSLSKEPGHFDFAEEAVGYVKYFLTEILKLGEKIEGVSAATLNQNLIDRIMAELKINKTVDCTTV